MPLKFLIIALYIQSDFSKLTHAVHSVTEIEFPELGTRICFNYLKWANPSQSSLADPKVVCLFLN